MFADIHRVEFDIFRFDAEGRRVEINPWDYLPHTYFHMSLSEAKIFLVFLQTHCEVNASGKIDVWTNSGKRTYMVRDNVVDLAGS